MKETIILIANKPKLTSSNNIIDLGSKPILPKDLIKNMLPKTPAILFPIIPKEYFLKTKPKILALTIPIKY